VVPWSLKGPLPVESLLHSSPETRAYCISGSTELFPQHCQIPCLTKHQHFWALTEELAKVVEEANVTPAGRRLIKTLQMKIKHALNLPDVQEEQRVREQEQRMARENEQRVIDDTPILTIPRITDAPAIMQSRNPMAKRMLKNNPRVHHPPSPGEHLGLFWRKKKHQVFSPAAADET
jgi:hypothetical protein